MSQLKVCLFGLMLFMSFSLMAQPMVNVNTADAQVLAEHIKGVGHKKAQAIVEYRDKHGPFASIEGLMSVPGIGNKTLELNRKTLTTAQE